MNDSRSPLLRERIKQKREQMGLSHNQVAARVGVVFGASIGRYERRGLGLSRSKVALILKILDFSTKDIEAFERGELK